MINTILFSLREKVLKKNTKMNSTKLKKQENHKIEILVLSTFPPRECGIATYSQDLVKALNNKFNQSFKFRICPLESNSEQHIYDQQVNFVLNTEQDDSYTETAKLINENISIDLVLLQHEFGLFNQKEDQLIEFLSALNKPIIIVFHTVLKNPDEKLKLHVRKLAEIAQSLIVMTNFSAQLLQKDYAIPKSKIAIIPHGTHLVKNSDKELLKEKHNLSDKKVLATFGLLSSGKSIETSLEALPQIIAKHPEVIFLILGKTHPTIVKREGEIYRDSLKEKIAELNLSKHVKFVNDFIPLPELLDYLQLTDIYLFTSKDPNQAVSGTFSYAISCGCPIISTPIPHATEVLSNDIGKIIDFEDSTALANEVNLLLNDEESMNQISLNCLHKMASTAWENTAITHALLFKKVCRNKLDLHFNLPKVNLDHIKKMTTGFGIIQFSKINHPDIDSGFTLDDNARAMVAICQHYELTKNEPDLELISSYLNFIAFCMQKEGYFLNYVDEYKSFTEQNQETNLADSNGRAIWALGYLISLKAILPEELSLKAEALILLSLPNMGKIHSTRAMSFAIKGLYYRNLSSKTDLDLELITLLADRLVQMYKHEKDQNWMWFESYLTYANSIIPEALLCGSLATGKEIYKDIAKESFDFLLSKTFNKNEIKIISNQGWMHKGKSSEDLQTHFNRVGGEQPIDVAYTILALNKFYSVFKEENYRSKMQTSFNWFLGNNHLNQIIYNPTTGGCYDGLEKNYVNLNQGAESTVSYLMARLCIEKANLDLIPVKILDIFNFDLNLKLLTT